MLYFYSLQEILQDAESFEIDIPKIWESLGDLFSAFTKDNSDYLRLVAEGCEPLVPIGKASVVLANTLSRIAKNLVSYMHLYLYKASDILPSGCLRPPNLELSSTQDIYCFSNRNWKCILFQQFWALLWIHI